MRWVWVLLACAAGLLLPAAPAPAADPPPLVLNGPSGPTNVVTPTFTFTSQDTNVTFTCRLDGPGNTPGTDSACTSPDPLPGLADGAYEFTVTATGDQGTAQASHSFTLDRVAPETTITSGPEGRTNHASVAFRVNSTESDSTFECRLTGPGHETDDFAACDAGAAYTHLADGDYAFAARARDAAGNVDASPAIRSFTVDTTPPGAPALSGTPAGFDFSSEPGTTFQCALDGPTGPGTFAPCVPPLSLPGLPPGTYTLRVRATDAVGNTGPEATLTFTVAAPPPAPAPLPEAPIPLLPPLLPVFHGAVVARPGLADVSVRLPGSARYVQLTADRALPLGSILDTRRGTVQLLTVSRRGGKPQRANLVGGVFRVTQPGGMTVLTLVGPCRPARRLAGDGRGAFAVRGRFSTTTIRGSRWSVEDSCSGTLTRVSEGVVQVRDLARRRTVLVRAGRRYVAKP